MAANSESRTTTRPLFTGNRRLPAMMLLACSLVIRSPFEPLGFAWSECVAGVVEKPLKECSPEIQREFNGAGRKLPSTQAPGGIP